jgi:hypothetical protein
MNEHAGTRTRKSASIRFLEIAIGVFIALVLIYLLWPTVTSERHGPRRPHIGIQLKQIAWAMHNYQDAFKKFPRAYDVDEQGRRTNSWRVRLLPFLEQERAYEELQRGESLTKVQKDQLRSGLAHLFHDPDNRAAPKEQTSIMVITGPGTMFEEGKDFTFADCKDGTSETILAVEVRKSGVNWDEAVDLDIRTMVMKINASDNNGIGSRKGKGAHVALVDGSVRYLDNDTLESTLRAMITRGGGEKIGEP